MQRLFYLGFIFLLSVCWGFLLDGTTKSFAQFRKWGGGYNGSLEFEFKTEQLNGILLYTDDGGTYDFFVIKLFEGALQLRFNLGGGAQILTVGSNLNDGHWHKVHLQRQAERTVLTVDGTSHMRTSRGKEFDFGRFSTNSDVFVGGMPMWYNNKLTLLALPSVIFEPRFVGHVRNLIYADTEHGPPRRQETRPRDHRCDGGAVAGTEEVCLPQSRILHGNSSDVCESRDPCQHDGICVSTDNGPICECRNSEFEGVFCEKDKAPTEASFRGNEYLSYDLSQTGSDAVVSTQDSMTFYFKTRVPSGLLFYLGDGSDYLNVAIKEGCLILTMGLSNGKQEMQIKPNKVRFDDNQWHKVSIHRKMQEVAQFTSFCRLSAVVDGAYADHSHIAGKFKVLSSTRIFLGGSEDTRALPGTRVNSNFVGCMKKEVIITSLVLFFFGCTGRRRLELLPPANMDRPLKKLATRASETLGSNSNLRRPVHPIKDNINSLTGRESLNKFVEFTADTMRLNLLELGKSGSELISTAGRLEYRCPAGETRDPITFTTRESHLILPSWNAKKSGNISFKFRTNEPNGLILFNGGVRPPRSDLFAIEIYNGHIYVHLDLGSGPWKQRGSRKRIDDNTWHEVAFRRTGRDAKISVDGFHTDFKTPEGSTSLELDGHLYVGGLGPPFSDIPIPSAVWTAVLGQGFVGCFKDLVVNNNNYVDIAGYAREQDSGSIRTLCHVQPLQCPSQPCLNGGICSEGWNRFICDCTNTLFTGPTCSKEAATLRFNSSEYMQVTMDTEMETQTEEIVLRFRTKKPLGLLLITSTAETGDRVELAVAAGRIRMALRMGVRKKKDEDKEKDKILLAGQHVNDNEWHTVKFSRRGVNLKLQLDGHTPLRAETHGTHTTLQWRRIYIGGVQDELGMSTTVPNFVGEIQQFYFNGISYIELAKSSSTEQKIAGFPGIKVAAKFVKRLINNLHRPVTFRSQHTFIGLPMLRAYSSIHVDFLFKTKHANGLILFNGGKKDDFIAIELVNGHIHYVLNVGEGPIKLKDASKTPLNDNHWHTVGIRRPSLKQHTLMVDDDVVVAANQGTAHLELDGILYVGGVHRDLYSQLPQGDVKSKLGFEGCIAGLDLNGESPNIMEDAVIHSSEVTAGCESQSSKCDRNFCANGGVCVQQWPSYTCDCDMTSFTGPNCSDESIAYEFGPNRGIITYTFPEDRRPEMQDDAIALGFITSKSDAVLLRLVSGTSTDYIELEIVDGNVFMVYNLGTHDHPVGEISFKVNDNTYHVVKFRRFGSNATLQVDDYNVQYVAPSGDQLQVFNSQSQIQIGGKWSPGKSRIERPFTGIIAGVVVNGIRILDLAAAKDVHTFTRGDVQLISNILERHIDTIDLHKMQQTPASGFSGVMDDLVLSGSGSGCNNGDDEDECPPLPDSGGTDDLITPVFIPPTKPPPTTKLPSNPNEPEPCDDEECGSASGEITEEPPNTSSKGTSAEIPGINVTETSTHQGTDGSSIYTSEGGSTGVSSSSEITRKAESHSTISTDTDTLYPDGSSTSTTMSSSTPSEPTTTTTTMTHKIPEIPPTKHDEFPFVTTKPPRKKPTERVHSEMSEAVALIIGIIAGALIAVILIILVILKFKSRGDRSYKVDDGKGGYQHGPSTALLGTNGSANEQTPYQLNGALRNGETRGQMQKSSKKRDSKDIKEWYV